MMVAMPGLHHRLFDRGLGRFGDARPVNPQGGPSFVAGAPPGCPLLSDGTCAVGGDPTASTSCVLIRECDPLDKAVHWEYALPSGNVPNVNIWSIQADGTYVWLGSTGQPATPPPGELPPNANQSVPTAAQNWFNTWQQQQHLLTQPPTPPNYTPPVPPTTQPPTTPLAKSPSGTFTSSSSQTTQSNTLTDSTLISGVPDIAIYIGIGLAAFLLFKKG